MGTQLPLLKRGGALCPIFGPCPLWPNGWMDQDGTWHEGRPWSRPHCARWGPSSLPQKGGRTPSLIFVPFLLWTDGCMDQDATWYGGRPRPKRHCVRWGPTPHSQKGVRAASQIFGSCLLWPNGWMDQDGTWRWVLVQATLC